MPTRPSCAAGTESDGKTHRVLFDRYRDSAS